MKALLLAAGFGTRLRPLTNSIPKCLVPIKGVPLLEIWIKNLKKLNVESILINTHYLSNKVEDFLKKNNYNEICNIKYEKKLLGTAGTLMKSINFFENDDCMLIHADNYCTTDLNKLICAHRNRPKGTLLTMLTFRTENPESCGIVEINKLGIVENFYEKIKNPPGNLANGAVYILSKDFIQILKKEYKSSIEFTTDVLSDFLGQIYTFETNDIFIDIGTISSYNYANEI